ncbi:MAG: aconitate hydratase AcnA [Burkholderiales bacterium]|nr:aconitate hydratase AcnA [Burkholderiales bacterium]
MAANQMLVLKELRGRFGVHRIVDLAAAAGGDAALARMPWCHRVLLENVLRQPDAARVAAARDSLVAWPASARSTAEIDFVPLRILMHDTTCGPALVDIAAMRDALAEAGGDPNQLNPAVPVASSVDHSVALDRTGSPDALAYNMKVELSRNAERYRFMKWAGEALRGFRVYPPGTGIMHTLNLERLASVVTTRMSDGVSWALPDTLVGTDSHTPMVNGIGVLGWGVGGIEAEGVMFGLPVSLRIPEVFGVRLEGALRPGTSVTDLALVVTERLRNAGVAGEFVEFFGPGVAALSASERAVVANMAPEYGASTGCFPIDTRTLDYLRATGRGDEKLALIEAYARVNGLWYDAAATPTYTQVIEIALERISPSLAGPRRPHDRFDAADAPRVLGAALRGIPEPRSSSAQAIPADAVAIAAITSCTNTTDMGLLITAGLLARNARSKGLAPPPWVKTSLAPGSPAAARRLSRVGLLTDLEALGFAIAGYGCTTCIGNSGPLHDDLNAAIERGAAEPVAVLSGNRNFPGRVHAQIDSALLASPAMVVAYALAGRALVDVTHDVLGTDPHGQPVRLRDIWPDPAAIDAAVAAATDPSDVAAAAAEAEAAGPWRELSAPATPRFAWDPASTYLRRPPFVRFVDPCEHPLACDGTLIAYPLLVLGDDITTDHISPAGAIPPASDAGRWLIEHGDDPRDLNVYAARRGNFEVMLRGLFTNRTAINQLCPEAPPGHTVHAPSGETLPVWRAAQRYAQDDLPVVILAGERYGAGSSRDWAAKGAQMLGVRAIVAASFERIHRSNLIGMGVLPLQMPRGWCASALNVVPGDRLEIDFDLATLAPRAELGLRLRRRTGEVSYGRACVLLDTERDVELIRAGGIIALILGRSLGSGRDRSGGESWQ